MIFLRKQLASAQGRHRRIGIIGAVALVQRLGAAAAEGEAQPGAASAIGGWSAGCTPGTGGQERGGQRQAAGVTHSANIISCN